MSPEAIRRFHADLDQLTATHGHAVQGVFGTESSPTFCYTVGLWKLGWPELIVVGLDARTGQIILNLCVEKLRGGGSPPAPGTVLTGVANFPLMLGSVSQQNSADYLCQAIYQAERQGGAYCGAVQLVLCDAQGRFPLDPDFDHAKMDHLSPCLAENGWDYLGASSAKH